MRLCDLVRAVHEADHYPVVLQDDVEEFLVTDNCLAAWVAEVEPEIVGHVALHSVWSDDVARLAAASLRCAPDRLASVSRLFVDSSCRRRGLGAQLLQVATREAQTRGLWPTLDVVTTYASAIALYERCGWTRLGAITLPMPGGRTIDEYVYAAPGPS
jgi:GNAT superfamily N-acetyltransferase